MNKQSLLKPAWLYDKFVAHRGLHDASASENTIPAFKKAIDGGYNIEIDVQLTKDDIVVVFHDFALERLTDSDKNISDLTFEELQKVSYKGTNHKIPSLAEVLKLCENKTGLMIELKKQTIDFTDYKLEEAVLSMLKTYEGDFIVKSFNPYTVDFFREKAPEFVRGLLASYKEIDMYAEKTKQLVKELVSDTEKKIDFFDYYINNIGSNFFNEVYGTMPIIAWTIASQTQYDSIKDKVDNIIFESFFPEK